MSEDTTLGLGEAIAIVGMSGRFPGARSVEELWRNLESGIDSISHFAEGELEPSRLEAPGIRTQPNYVRARGIVEDADKLDAGFFGLTPREASMMDPQQRLFLEHTWSALESAGYDPQQYPGSIGVWGGTGTNTYFLENVLPRHDLVRAEQMVASQAMLANERDYLSTRVSYKLNLRGPSISVATACSTSLVAVCQASQALLGYQCDLALAGGAFVNSPQRRGYLYQEGAIGSPDGRCRPFDAEAAGTVFSDGVGVVVLKRLSEAIEEGDTIYAVIRGVAVNNDGSGKVSFTAPSIEGQAEVIALAQAVAGVSPATVSYVEAHGTATPLGDPIEIAALSQAFRAGTSATGFCGIGSVKGNLGHLDAAAGVAGLIKTALALHKGKIPPSLHFKSPNPKIDFANSPFYVVDKLRPWPAGSEPRRAGVSAFGVGGTNAHVVLEEAPRHAGPGKPARPHHLVVLSARTPAALEEATANLSRYLRDTPQVELADVAHTLQVGRRAMGCRRAIVGRSATDVAEALDAADPTRVRTRLESAVSAKVAFLFPGQGAQHVGMAHGLYRSEPTFRAELDACAEAFRRHLDVDIRDLIFAEGADQVAAERRLAETSITQPAMFAVEYAMAQLWLAWGVTPAAMIGHSLGEYVAACVAGVLSREAAAAVIAARGQLIERQPRGLMMAVRLPAGELEPHLGPQVAIAALNAPRLTVVSGPADSVRALEGSLSELGVGCKMLATSHAFHSAMMDAALVPFREVLAKQTLTRPRLPWVSCLTGDWIRPEQAVDPEYWVQQMRQPVRFSEGVHLLANDPPHILLEVGPGQTLSGLARQQRDLPSPPQVISSAGRDAEHDIPSLLDAAGRLWTCGVKVDWGALRGQQARRRVPLPTYPFERRRHWIDPLPLPGDLGAGAPGVEPLSQVAEETQAAPLPSPGEPVVPASVAGRLGALLGSASGIPVAEIAAARSFLEMGFDSLLLIQVSRALERTFGLEISFRQLLEDFPSPGALADHIEARLAAAPAVDRDVAGSGADLLPAAGDDAGRVPLSEAQREIWAAVQMGPEASCAYNLCFALRLVGDVSVDSLRGAAQQLFDRHEALRITIDPSGEWQTVRPPHPVDIAVTDLAPLSPQERQAALERLLADEVGTPLGLTEGVPARVRLVIEGPDRCVLVLTAHHIACDGWSAWIFFRELAVLYSAGRRGRPRGEPASLPSAEPFRRFVQAGDRPSGRQRAAASQVYWQSRFEGGVPVLDLPLDRSRPLAKTYRGAMEALTLDAEQSAGIKRAAAQQGSTVVGFLFAAFHVLLYRLTRQMDLVIGLPVSVREAAERETLVGHATNLLPVRLAIDSQASFTAHLRTARTALLDAVEHQAQSFGALLRGLHLRWDPSRTPLVAATFNLDRGRVPPDFEGAEATIFMPPRRHVNFELEMNVADLGNEFVLECSYNPDLLDKETIRRWLAHYARLLAAAVTEPETPLARLPLLTEAELEVQRQWNETRADGSRVCVHELVSAQAARTPERVAIEGAHARLTYRELEERSELLARRLRGRGVGSGVRVGVFMERSPEMVVAVLGVLKSGGAYVPLDPAFPTERLRYMLEDSKATVVLTHAAVVDQVPVGSAAVMRVDEAGGPEGDLAGVPGSPGDLAYVIYTSGSTGRPKGVAVTHGSLVNLLESMAVEPGLCPQDVLLSVTTLSFDIAALELYLPLIAGAKVVLASREETLDGRLLIERLRSSGATVMQATPASWRLLLDSGWSGNHGLKVLCGGEALPRDLADELLARAREVWNLYGPTETTVWSSVWRVQPGGGPISIGHPIRNTRMWVLDAELQPQPVGVPGELYIGGLGVARGYWERPDLTSERFVPDPFSEDPGSRLYRTGDRALRLPSGDLWCLGRIDNQVKIRGFRIELGEIEAALRECEGVAEAAVVTQGSSGGIVRLVAFLVPMTGTSPRPDDLRARLGARLPAYMVPSSFVFLPALPLTPNGKVDRKALSALEAGAPSEHEDYVAPRTPTEQAIAEIWIELLGVPRVSIYDNFFDLGGHSLLSTRVVSRIEQRLGKRLGVGQLILQNLAQVAAKCDQAGHDPGTRGLRATLRRWFGPRPPSD